MQLVVQNIVIESTKFDIYVLNEVPNVLKY